MLTVEQLRAVRPEQVAGMAGTLRAHADTISSVVSQSVESAGQDLAGWQGPAAAASTAHRHALTDDAHRLTDAHGQASGVLSGLADRLDQARQLLALADSFAQLVGCTVQGRAEVSVLPPTMLGPLASVYDSVRRTAGSLAAQALVVAEAADLHASHALGERQPCLPAADAAVGSGDDADGLLAAATSAGPAEPDDADVGRSDAETLERLAAQECPAAELAPAVMLFYAALSLDRRRALRRNRHRWVAALPGAPVQERYAANRRLVDENRAELRRHRTELAAAPAAQRAVARSRTLDAINQRIGTLNSLLASRTVAAVDPRTGERASSHHTRQFLAFDPSGPGRAAEVFGDLDTARHVAVLIPGGRNGLDTFNALAVDARLLADTAGPDCAVVTWLGYDSVGAGTPSAGGGQHSATSARTRTDASALRRFLGGLTPCLPPSARLILVGHGSGTVLLAAALRAGQTADDVVLVGSPGLGTRIRSAADLRPASPGPSAAGTARVPAAGSAAVPAELLPGPVITAPRAATRFWALRAPGDAIAYTRAFGADPAEFGDVTRLDTQGGVEVLGHTRYYTVGSESLDNLARVVAGRLDVVTVTDTTMEEELMLADLDDPTGMAPPPATPAPVSELAGVLDAVGVVGGTWMARGTDVSPGTGIARGAESARSAEPVQGAEPAPAAGVARTDPPGGADMGHAGPDGERRS